MALLSVFAIGLLTIGIGYLVLSVTTTLLPSDLAFLGVDRSALCQGAECRVIDFVTHNRAAHGGTLAGSGVLALWLTASPLRRGQTWPWWALLAGGAIQLASLAGVLAYGQPAPVVTLLTAASLLAWAAGLLLTRPAPGSLASLRAELPSLATIRNPTRSDQERAFLTFLGLSFFFAGLGVLTVALTTVFVPQDLDFLRTDKATLDGISDGLLTIMAADRAQFGAGMATLGVLFVACASKGVGTRSQLVLFLLALAGALHFVVVLGSHFAIGYTDLFHLAPVYAASGLLIVGLYAMQRSYRVEASREPAATPASTAAEPLRLTPAAAQQTAGRAAP